MQLIELAKEYIRHVVTEKPRTVVKMDDASVIQIGDAPIFFVNMKERILIPKNLYDAINNDNLIMSLMKKHYRELPSSDFDEILLEIEKLQPPPQAPRVNCRKRLLFE